jgi:hypothetical protein
MCDAAIGNRKEILEFLRDIQSHYGTYHNHKETVAWGGVVLFSGLLAGVTALFFGHDAQSMLTCSVRSGFSFAIIAALLICLLYVKKQFDLRKQAGDIVAACIRLRTEMVGNPARQINLEDWVLPMIGNVSMQSSHVLPRAVKETAEQLAQAGGRSRVVLESCAYAILIGVGVALIVRVWLFG